MYHESFCIAVRVSLLVALSGTQALNAAHHSKIYPLIDKRRKQKSLFNKSENRRLAVLMATHPFIIQPSQPVSSSSSHSISPMETDDKPDSKRCTESEAILVLRGTEAGTNKNVVMSDASTLSASASGPDSGSSSVASESFFDVSVPGGPSLSLLAPMDTDTHTVKASGSGRDMNEVSQEQLSRCPLLMLTAMKDKDRRNALLKTIFDLVGRYG